MPNSTPPELAAAVDLGSNSFHLMIARVDSGRLSVVDRVKERVQLAAGLDEHGALRPEAIAQAIEALRRIGQRLRELPLGKVRVVGTNTLRRARNRDALIAAGSQALGHPIEVVSGREEARLIYLGVAHSAADADPDLRRLVLDIGGGSTEVVIGEGPRPLAAESMFMGCVGFTQRFFPDGLIDEHRYEAAYIAARLEMEPHKKLFRSMGWQRALGSSGTILAAEQAIRARGFGHTIDERSLKRLRKAVLDAGQVDRLPAALEMAPDRAQVFPAGLAVLDGVMRSLRLSSLEATTGSIREGMLIDLLGRHGLHDVREATVSDLMRRFGVDGLQAARVERTVRALHEAVDGRWLPHDPGLVWILLRAARLHELGLAIAHSGYHRHGAYLLAQADLPGFSRQEQEVLASLVRAHRRRIRPEYFSDLSPALRKLLPRYAVLLRLAVRLHRGRSDRALPPFTASVPKAPRPTLALRFPDGWLASHPLSAADLEREQGYMAEAGMDLRLEG